MIEASSFTTFPDLVSLKGRLANIFNISFGQSPAVAAAMAKEADDLYRGESNDITNPGTILYSAVHVSEPSGKPLQNCQRVSVKLSLWEDSDKRIPNMRVRRKTVLKRVSTQAYDQEGVLTIEDCHRLMQCSVRVIKQYIAELKSEGIYLPLRGYVHSTGRGQTHKTEIICFYLEGMPLEEIQLRTYHSIEAIARYITAFQRIVVCHAKQGMSGSDIATVVNVSSDLVKEYLQIYEKYSAMENERLGLILNPAEFENYIQPLKKKAK